jgi:hypothetical protein
VGLNADELCNKAKNALYAQEEGLRQTQASSSAFLQGLSVLMQTMPYKDGYLIRKITI